MMELPDEPDNRLQGALQPSHRPGLAAVQSGSEHRWAYWSIDG